MGHGVGMQPRHPFKLDLLHDCILSLLLQVDLISFTGPTFAGYDNRVAALRLVQKGLCDAALFDPSGIP